MKPARLTAVTRRPPKRPDLPPAVAQLPASTPLVLYAPSLARALEETERLADMLSVLEPELSKPLGRLAVDAIWGFDSLSELSAPVPVDPAKVLTTAGLEAAGIDTSAPLLVLPSLEEEVVVLRFQLESRRRFEAWLDALAGKERRRVLLGGESASVIGPDSPRPVACLARHAHAFCQLGVNAGDDALSDLSRAVASEGVAYGRLRGVAAAWERLPQDAVLYAFFNPGPFAKGIAKLAHLRERMRTRFADRRSKRDAFMRARRFESSVLEWSRLLDGAALALFFGDAPGARLELSMTARGRRALDDVFPERTTRDLIGRWTETPALFSLLVHADPAFVQRVARSYGLMLPQEMLTGTVGLLTLGLDPDCPSAKQGTKQPLDWAFLLPSALNVGLTAPEAADRIHGLLEAQLPARAAGDRKVAWLPNPRAPITGLAAGSPFEIHVLDRMLVVGTGPGSGAAALRRLASVRSRAPAGKERAPFFVATVQPQAIDAAFAAAAFGREHRRELLTIESLRLRLKPLLERIGALKVEATTPPEHRRVSVRLAVE